MPATRHRLQVRLAGLLIIAAALAGCAQPMTPEQVADRFWRAVITQHVGKIRRYVMAGQREQLKDSSELLPVATFALGRIVIDGVSASIETQLTLDADTPVPVAIETRLVQEDGQWKIDYESTARAILINGNLAGVMQQIGEIGESLQKGIEQSVDEMNKALPAIQAEIDRLEERIEERMPELREKLEAFSKRIEEALKAPPQEQVPDTPRPPASGGQDTIAL